MVGALRFQAKQNPLNHHLSISSTIPSFSLSLSTMCPLRLILLFLSATLAGFFVLRNLKSKPDLQNPEESVNPIQESTPSIPRSEKVVSAIGSGFWTCVDMASGRYLWRNLVSSKRSD